MKEFNNWFKISFTFRGKYITQLINLHKIEKDEEYATWVYRFSEIIDGEKFNFDVWGSIDDDNDIRTSGECYINGVDEIACFGVDITDDDGYDIGYIDDIDIIDSD